MTGTRLATIDDTPRIGAVLGAAFEDDPVMAWVFADGKRPAIEAMFTFLAPEVYVPLGATHVHGDSGDGGDGVIVWTPPSPPDWPEDRGARFVAALAAASPQDIARLGVLATLMGENHPPQPHWYLSVVGCAPERRGNGIGSRLLEATLPVVDDAHLPAYLESSNERNVPLYERFGFRVTSVVDLAEGGPSMQLMWRDAR